MNRKFQWINRKDQEVPDDYNWVILGFDVDASECALKCECSINSIHKEDFAWQIGRRAGNELEFWGSENCGGPYQGDAFWTWQPEQSTHWMEFLPWKFEVYNPEGLG